MHELSLLPADIYTVINKTVLTEKDKDIIITLYTPLIGSLPVTLYLNLWKDLNKLEIISKDLTHHHLMSLLRSDINSIKKARETLEAVGLIKSFVKKEHINKYVYELYSPLSAQEFFNHPILSVALYNNLGKYEFEYIKEQYTSMKFNLEGYQEITKKLNEVYKSSDKVEQITTSERTSLGISISDIVDFELLTNMMPKGIVNQKTFTPRTKELINNLAFIYNIDTYKIGEIIRQLINHNGAINSEELKNQVRKFYQYNNASLPTIVYDTQPEYLKSEIKDNSKKSKMISIFENTNPYELLRAKNKGAKPTTRDLKIIEELITVTKLKPAVVNVIVDYALKKNDNKLNKSYIEAIAGQLKRNGIETAKDALESIQKEQKRLAERTPTKYKKTTKTEPIWFNNVSTIEAVDQELQKELENALKGYQ